MQDSSREEQLSSFSGPRDHPSQPALRYPLTVCANRRHFTVIFITEHLSPEEENGKWTASKSGSFYGVIPESTKA
jgi:hypothetical protein